IRTDRETPQPLQINVQIDGQRAGSICLYDREPVSEAIRRAKYDDFSEFVTRTRSMQYALVGGAPAGDDQPQNRTYFTHEVRACDIWGIPTGGEPKDKLQADGLRALLGFVDDIKPNEGELYLIQECVLNGKPYSRELKREARGEGAEQFVEDPRKVVELYKALSSQGSLAPGAVWIATLGKEGAVYKCQGYDSRIY
ncbi:hypothetical protein ACFLZ6_01670, partial [Nanoarchaeota archaeon]